MTSGGKQRREEILRATLDLVAEQGLTGTAVSHISKRAQAGPGVIYHYFASKDAIIHAVFGQTMQQYSQFLMVGFPTDSSWQHQLKHIWLRSYTFYIEHPNITKFQEQYKSSPYYDPQQALDSDPILAQMVAMILAEVDKGVIQDMPYPALHVMTIGVAMNLAKLHISGAFNPEYTVLERLAAACCRSIAVGVDD